jgi:hypothetical protein
MSKNKAKNDVELCEELVREMGRIFIDEDARDVLAAISVFLSFIVHKEEPDNGMFVLMQVVSRAAELAYGITAEIVPAGDIQ